MNNQEHPKVTLLGNRKSRYVSFLHPGRGNVRTHRSLYTTDLAQAKAYAVELSALLRGEKRFEDASEVVKLIWDTSPAADQQRNVLRRAFMKGKVGRKRSRHPYVSLQENNGMFAFVFRHPATQRQVRRSLQVDHETAIRVAQELSQLLVNRAQELPEGCSEAVRSLWEHNRCSNCGAMIVDRRHLHVAALDRYSTASLLAEIGRRCRSDSGTGGDDGLQMA